jgi:hypothetical protein
MQVADIFDKLQTLCMHMAMLLLYDARFKCRAGQFPFHATTQQMMVVRGANTGSTTAADRNVHAAAAIKVASGAAVPKLQAAMTRRNHNGELVWRSLSPQLTHRMMARASALVCLWVDELQVRCRGAGGCLWQMMVLYCWLGLLTPFIVVCCRPRSQSSGCPAMVATLT